MKINLFSNEPITLYNTIGRVIVIILIFFTEDKNIHENNYKFDRSIFEKATILVISLGFKILNFTATCYIDNLRPILTIKDPY